MQKDDFPALFRSADELSLRSQKRFFCILFINIFTLIAAAVLSAISNTNKYIVFLQVMLLVVTSLCSIYLWKTNCERHWYAGRAIAESVKTITWRYICKAEPFQNNDEDAQDKFKESLKMIFELNEDIFKNSITYANGEQITHTMQNCRQSTLSERKVNYYNNRIEDQYSWYSKKAEFNKKMSENFFSFLISVNIIGLLMAILKLTNINPAFLPVDIMLTIAAGLLSWAQAKKFTDLSSSYALTAHEISFIKTQFESIKDNEEKFSLFVGDAENAFSREHTQWAARRDVWQSNVNLHQIR
ncbi:DUF4231 domain-containing protein [Cardiobacterium hominis]|jgi:anthranilate synthase component I|uniref:DUF4231 domain-containing protein n=1 Tax=Cardiobacterium hominis TaxID=2718 RepID=UPI0009E64EF9|nr:DUF4231 domain-containing protein [Cardiobacterium hominis]